MWQKVDGFLLTSGVAHAAVMVAAFLVESIVADAGSDGMVVCPQKTNADKGMCGETEKRAFLQYARLHPSSCPFQSLKRPPTHCFHEFLGIHEQVFATWRSKQTKTNNIAQIN